MYTTSRRCNTSADVETEVLGVDCVKPAERLAYLE